MKLKRKKKHKKKDSLFTRIKKRIFHEEELNESFSMFEVIIIIIISILFGIVIGYIITCSKLSIYNDKNISEIVNVYDKLTTNYYDSIDRNKVSDAAIKGMVESLEDPYSNYMDNSTANEFNKTVEGSFTGVGITVMYEDGYYRIIEVFKGSPAEKAGIKIDDLLIKVDDIDVKDNESAFHSIVKGKVGTKVKLTVKRNDKEIDFTIKRSVIELEMVHNTIFEYEGKQVGYVHIEAFSNNSYKQFEKAMNRFTRKKIDYLVIDVRDNPGGSLERTREILSKFFTKKTVLFEIQNKKMTKKVKSLNNSIIDYPVAVLINAGSASASEILASCFQENYDNAIIVGEKSYGKGTIQKSQSLSNGTSIKYTTDKWLTSKGKFLGGKGVKPDIEVLASEEYYNSPNYSNDNQLQEALKALKESN